MDSIIAHSNRPNSNILARGEKPKSRAGSAPAAAPGPSGQGVEVGISVKVRRTFDLDTVQEQFGAMLHILMKWETDDVDADADDGVTTWEPEWQPRWVIKNVMEYIDKRYAFSAEPSVNGKKKTTVYFEARCLVRIKQEHMDLHMFPFDTQDFEVGVEIEATDARDVRFIPYEDHHFEGALPVGEADMLRCHFDDMDPVAAEAKYFVAAEIYETDRSKSRRGISYSGVKLQMRFRRLSRYYLSNVACICFFISSFGFSAWAMPSDEVSDRLSVDFTLLLTAVAFKLVATSMLPRVNYFTKLDVYVFACLLFLCTATALHSLLPFLARIAQSHVVDKVSFWILGTLWVAFNIYTCFSAYFHHKNSMQARGAARSPRSQPQRGLHSHLAMMV